MRDKWSPELAFRWPIRAIDVGLGQKRRVLLEIRGGGTEIPLPVESRLRKFWVNLDRRLPIVLQNNMDEVPTAENALCPGGGRERNLKARGSPKP